MDTLSLSMLDQKTNTYTNPRLSAGIWVCTGAIAGKTLRLMDEGGSVLLLLMFGERIWRALSVVTGESSLTFVFWALAFTPWMVFLSPFFWASMCFQQRPPACVQNGWIYSLEPLGETRNGLFSIWPGCYIQAREPRSLLGAWGRPLVGVGGLLAFNSWILIKDDVRRGHRKQ
jgi:hypothetical protein